MRCSGNGLKQSVLSGQFHQQVNFHNPRRAVIGRETTNSKGGTQVAAPVTGKPCMEDGLMLMAQVSTRTKERKVGGPQTSA